MTDLDFVNAKFRTEFDRWIAARKASGNLATAKRIGDEKRMASALVKAALKRGFRLSVNDGEEWTVIRSLSYWKVMAALFTTDMDYLKLVDGNGKGHGTFMLA